MHTPILVNIDAYTIVSDIAIFVLKRDVKLQLTDAYTKFEMPSFTCSKDIMRPHN